MASKTITSIDDAGITRQQMWTNTVSGGFLTLTFAAITGCRWVTTRVNGLCDAAGVLQFESDTGTVVQTYSLITAGLYDENTPCNENIDGVFSCNGVMGDVSKALTVKITNSSAGNLNVSAQAIPDRVFNQGGGNPTP